MMKRAVILLSVGAVMLLCPAVMVFAQEGEAAASAAAASAGTSVWKYFAAALAVGISCIAGGIAVGQIGAAAMGAMSENPELAGKAIPYAGLAEGICLWGFLVGLLILVL
jgi:V/A-type H+-transporting ATPase subunit K